MVLCLGNEVVFSLETASDYMKNESSITYGFKCLVIGYDWITSGHGLKNLEIELSFLGGACAASLMKKNLLLPPVSCKYNMVEFLFHINKPINMNTSIMNVGICSLKYYNA